MQFEWDPEKARTNRVKHRIDFETARRVWDDPLMVLLPDRIRLGEERRHAVGVVGPVLVLVVVHLYLDADDMQRVRIISARRATHHERRQYEDGA